MNVSVLSPSGPLVSVSGLLQVASLLSLVLLLIKASQLYLHRQWLGAQSPPAVPVPTLPLALWTLQGGFTVSLSIYGLHHNPKVWTNPEVFDPSRFAPGSARHSHAFVPFSGGSRNCIGKQFPMNEMKVAVALTLLRFELMPDPSQVPAPIARIVLKSNNGIHLHLRKLL